VRDEQPIQGPTRLEGFVNGHVSGREAASSGKLHPLSSEPSRWLSMWRALIEFWFILWPITLDLQFLEGSLR
jgi:hypothetical protein